MKKDKFFINSVIKLCGQLKINRPLLQKDNRLGKNYIASVCKGQNIKTKKYRYIIRYNATMLKTTPKCDIIHAVLHELGHVKTTAKLTIDREYKAEKFAVKAIKKYYPQYYKSVLNYLQIVSKFKDKIYPKAFGKLLKEIK